MIEKLHSLENAYQDSELEPKQIYSKFDTILRIAHELALSGSVRHLGGSPDLNVSAAGDGSEYGSKATLRIPAGNGRGFDFYAIERSSVNETMSVLWIHRRFYLESINDSAGSAQSYAGMKVDIDNQKCTLDGIATDEWDRKTPGDEPALTHEQITRCLGEVMEAFHGDLAGRIAHRERGIK